jgi:hypothetical protein
VYSDSRLAGKVITSGRLGTALSVTLGLDEDSIELVEVDLHLDVRSTSRSSSRSMRGSITEMTCEDASIHPGNDISERAAEGLSGRVVRIAKDAKRVFVR